MQEQGHNVIAVATTSSGSNGSSQEVNINYKMNTNTNTSNFEFSCKTSPVRTADQELHQQFNFHGTPISDSSKPDRYIISSEAMHICFIDTFGRTLFAASV